MPLQIITGNQIPSQQRSQSAFGMHSPKSSQSNYKTICVWLSWCCAHKNSKAVHQANWSTEKDCLVNEVWSGATEGCVCHQIYSTAALWFPAAVKQSGGDWSKLHCSCQPPDCLQPFDGVSLLPTNSLSPAHTCSQIQQFFPSPPTLLLSLSNKLSKACFFVPNVKTHRRYMAKKLHND